MGGPGSRADDFECCAGSARQPINWPLKVSAARNHSFSLSLVVFHARDRSCIIGQNNICFGIVVYVLVMPLSITKARSSRGKLVHAHEFVPIAELLSVKW